MAEFFVRRPIVAMVIAIIMVLIGLLAMNSLPIAQYPEITPPMVSVTASYTGANAVNVKVSQLVSVQQLVSCTTSDTIEHIRHLMNRHHIRHLPVIDDYSLVSVVSMRDIAAAVDEALNGTPQAAA